MKTFIIIGLFLCALSLCGQETYYMKEIIRADTYKDGLQTESKIIGENEIWMSEHQIALLESDRTILLNMSQNEISIILPKNKSYITTTLPLNNSSVTNEELRNYLGLTTGKVSKLEGTKTILSKTCSAYIVEIWDKNNKKSGKRILKVWSTTEVPFNYGLYTELLKNMRIIYNRDKKLRNELLEIKGVQLYMESVIEKSDVEKRIVTEVVNFEKKELPEGIFDIPEGFTKIEMLTKKDFEK